MGWDITLNDAITGRIIEFDAPHQIKGGTYAFGGTTTAWLSVTYNYSKYYFKLMDEERGIRVIYGMTGAESIPILKKAIAALKDDVSDDYWEPTEGNAKRALQGLLAFAQMRPDGVWDGD